MKKLFSMLCMASLLFAAGCGGDDNTNDDNNQQNNGGNNGDNGNSGDNGDSGNAGDNGDSGNAGDNGDNGNTGDNGDSGNAGDNGDNGDSGNTGESTWKPNEDILPVPANQVNTPGAACDESFVEFCDGEKLVYCGQESILDDPEVMVADCTSDGFNGKCLVMLETDIDTNGNIVSYNYGSCYATCDTAGAETSECGYDYMNYYEDTLDTYTCTSTSKGNLWILTDYDYCGTVCTNNTCETNKSCGDIDMMGSCKSNNAYFCDMDAEWENEVLHVIACGELMCIDDEDWGAYCE